MPDMTSLETSFWENFPSSLGGWYIWLLLVTKTVGLVCQILPRQLQWVGALEVGEEEAEGIWRPRAPLTMGWRWKEAGPGENLVGAGQSQGLHPWRINLTLAPEKGSTRALSTLQFTILPNPPALSVPLMDACSWGNTGGRKVAVQNSQAASAPSS